MRTSSSAETLTTAPRTRSTAATTGVRRVWSGVASARGSGSRALAAAAAKRHARARLRRIMRLPLVDVVLVLVVELVALEGRLDRHGLVGEVGERLQEG